MKSNDDYWLMKKEKKQNQVKKHKNMDKGTVFVRIMAAILAILMVGGTSISFIYALING